MDKLQKIVAIGQIVLPVVSDIAHGRPLAPAVPVPEGPLRPPELLDTVPGGPPRPLSPAVPVPGGL